MLLLQFPPTGDLIVYIVIAAAILTFMYVKFFRKDKEEETNVYTSSNLPSKKLETEDDSEEITDPLEELIEAVNIPTPLLRVMLNIPLSGVCLATTAKDAEEAFNNAESDSDEEYLALLKWIELENDLVNAVKMYDAAEAYHSIVEDLSVVTWSKLALQHANSISSEDDLVEALDNSPTGSEAEKIIIKKLYEIYKNKA